MSDMDLRRLKIQKMGEDGEEHKQGEVHSLPVLTLPTFEVKGLEVRATTAESEGGIAAVAKSGTSFGDPEPESHDHAAVESAESSGGAQKSGTEETDEQRRQSALFQRARVKSTDDVPVVLRSRTREQVPDKAPGVVSVRVAARQS